MTKDDLIRELRLDGIVRGTKPCYFTLKNDNVSYEWIDQTPRNLPYDEIRTITIDYNSKKITFFLDWKCF